MVPVPIVSIFQFSRRGNIKFVDRGSDKSSTTFSFFFYLLLEFDDIVVAVVWEGVETTKQTNKQNTVRF